MKIISNPQKYLECPNCGKYSVDDSLDVIKCLNCIEEFHEEDICMECEKLVKGSCYYCKMD